MGIAILTTFLVALLAGDPPAGGAAPAPAPGGFLAGPAVKEAAPAAPTLIERAFDGTLVPLDDEPGVVAAYRVVPAPEERAQLDAIAARRSAAFGAILDEHYQLFTALGTDLRRAAQMTPDERAGLLRRLAEVRDLLKPFAARGSFIDEATAVLGEQRAAQARAMVDAWRAARIADMRKELGDAAPDDARLAAREQLQELGAMVRRTIERRADFAKAQFEDLAKRLELTPEQAEKVRGILMASAVRRIQGDRGGLSRRERQELFGELAKVLDESQRAALREIILDR